MVVNKIYNENCLDTISRMADSFIDLTVTSPPYDGLRTYNGYSFDFESIAKELFRITKQGGVVVWVVGDATINGSETGTSFKQALFFMECGFNLYDTMIYRKVNYIPLTHRRYEQEFEYMFVFSKSKPKRFNPIRVECKHGGKLISKKSTFYKDSSSETSSINALPVQETKIKGNVFEYIVGAPSTGKIKHPAMFPEKLAHDMITSWSNEGDLVYDPFMGSGTTAKIATINNRFWIGSEISEEYCYVIEQRIKNIIR